jgi:hypothetical protein
MIKYLTKQLCDEIAKLDSETKIEALNDIRFQLHQQSPLKHHPVDFIRWVKSEKIEANEYNPNAVAPPEMKMLKKHIKTDGHGSAQELGEVQEYKATPKKYKSDIIENYLKARDRLFWLEGTPDQRLEIEQRWVK